MLKIVDSKSLCQLFSFNPIGNLVIRNVANGLNRIIPLEEMFHSLVNLVKRNVPVSCKLTLSLRQMEVKLES